MAHKHQNNKEIIHEVMGKFSQNSKNHKIKKKLQNVLIQNWKTNENQIRNFFQSIKIAKLQNKNLKLKKVLEIRGRNDKNLEKLIKLAKLRANGNFHF
jgi:DNA-binding IscR family transcriptional regulator